MPKFKIINNNNNNIIVVVVVVIIIVIIIELASADYMLARFQACL